MYYYIIDPQKTSQRDFDRVQTQLYSCLSEHRISGELTRVTPLRTVAQLVETAMLRGTTTLVAVGHDSTLQEVINSVGDREVAIGYVPVQESEMSKALGIGDVISSCRSLAQRRIAVLDVGQIQNTFFFTKVGVGVSLESLQAKSLFDFSKFSAAAQLKPVPIRMEIDGQFSVEFEVAVGGIFNTRAARGENHIADPTDGILDILLLPRISSMDAWKYRAELMNGQLEKIPGCAVMHGRKIIVSGQAGVPFFVGEKTVAKAPSVIQIATHKVKMVVGKDRMF